MSVCYQCLPPPRHAFTLCDYPIVSHYPPWGLPDPEALVLQTPVPARLQTVPVRCGPRTLPSEEGQRSHTWSVVWPRLLCPSVGTPVLPSHLTRKGCLHWEEKRDTRCLGRCDPGQEQGDRALGRWTGRTKGRCEGQGKGGQSQGSRFLSQCGTQRDFMTARAGTLSSFPFPRRGRAQPGSETPNSSLSFLKMALTHPTSASCVSTLDQSSLLDAGIWREGIVD